VSISENKEGGNAASQPAAEPKLKIPTGILVVIATVALYVCTYAFEVGYASHFGYSVRLISFGLGSFLSLGGSVFGYVLVFFLFLRLTLPRWQHTRGNAGLLVFLLSALFISGIGITVANFADSLFWLFAVVFPTLLAGYAIPKERARIAAEQQKDGDPPNRSHSPDSIARKVETVLGFDPLSTVGAAVVILVPIAFVLLGWSAAHTNVRYFTFELGGEQRVVLRVTGSNVISAPFGCKANTFRRAFEVVPVTEVGLMERLPSAAFRPYIPRLGAEECRIEEAYETTRSMAR